MTRVILADASSPAGVDLDAPTRISPLLQPLHFAAGQELGKKGGVCQPVFGALLSLTRTRALRTWFKLRGFRAAVFGVGVAVDLPMEGATGRRFRLMKRRLQRPGLQGLWVSAIRSSRVASLLLLHTHMADWNPLP